jgi:hypothetical protein
MDSRNWKNMFPQELYVIVPGSIIHNILKVETTQRSIKCSMDGQNMVYLCKSFKEREEILNYAEK